MKRRDFLYVTASAVLGTACTTSPPVELPKRPNILFITIDDLNWDSLGVTGCPVPDISPNTDQLASEGIRFEKAHVNVAVCMPCREMLMTGQYAHRIGATGFKPILPSIPTVPQQLKKVGYLSALLAKLPHHQPAAQFPFDERVDIQDLGFGRSPEAYYNHTRSIIQKAQSQDAPFFILANVLDPHRPFPRTDEDIIHDFGKNFRDRPGASYYLAATELPVSRRYTPDEVVVPGFLPDLPDVRLELARYFTAVKRADDSTGALLKALDDTGCRDNTVVMYLSDNGMALPFAKTNCYQNSTKTPWIVRWPGVVKPGQVDSKHFISTIDGAPTLLDITGAPPLPFTDGHSFLPLLLGEKEPDRNEVFTAFHQTSARNDYFMSAITDKHYSYIYNAWSDGKTRFLNESQAGLTMNAMVEAAKTDPAIKARVQFFWYRVPEELYDVNKDPDALHNLADDPAFAGVLHAMQHRLLKHMEATDDPMAGGFRSFLERKV